jgi:hypothetical protein
MRKLLITAALATVVFSTYAQDAMTSKKGTPILPEAGDWSIGFNANPLLNYVGNIFNNTANNTVFMGYQQNMTLVGKYMNDATTAYRVKLRIGMNNRTIDNLVNQDGATTTPIPTVSDEWKQSSMDITLGGGIQKYRGNGRLKGFYGAEAAIMLGSGKHTYTYGNAMSATNSTPNSTDWNSPTTGGGYAQNPMGSRTTEDKAGSTFGFGIRGFVGAEYFFAPKMSIGAEYGWGLSMNSTGEGEVTNESYNGTAVVSTTSKTGKGSSFSLDVDNAGGAIMLSLYF